MSQAGFLPQWAAATLWSRPPTTSPSCLLTLAAVRSQLGFVSIGSNNISGPIPQAQPQTRRQPAQRYPHHSSHAPAVQSWAFLPLQQFKIAPNYWLCGTEWLGQPPSVIAPTLHRPPSAPSCPHAPAGRSRYRRGGARNSSSRRGHLQHTHTPHPQHIPPFPHPALAPFACPHLPTAQAIYTGEGYVQQTFNRPTAAPSRLSLMAVAIAVRMGL